MFDLLVNLEIFIHNHSSWGIPASFLGGVLVALSPCILPLLPVIISIIGEAALASKTKNLYLSIVFVLGVSTTYVSLGVIAAVFGIFLGKLIPPFLIYSLLGIVFIFLGLSFFDLFHFSVFDVNYKPKTNIISVFILGLLSGLAMLPCVFPVLGTILSVLSLKKNILYSVFCLFAFSLGYGAILSLIGSSAFFVRRLSEKGRWFIIIKRGLGIIILGVGVYFLVNVLTYLPGWWGCLRHQERCLPLN